MKIGLLRSKFLESIQNYQRVEQEGRVKVRQRAERQVRIGERYSPCHRENSFLIYLLVNPSASPEEVNVIVEGGSQQIFAQAVSLSSRCGVSVGSVTFYS